VKLAKQGAVEGGYELTADLGRVVVTSRSPLDYTESRTTDQSIDACTPAAHVGPPFSELDGVWAGDGQDLPDVLASSRFRKPAVMAWQWSAGWRRTLVQERSSPPNPHSQSRSARPILRGAHAGAVSRSCGLIASIWSACELDPKPRIDSTNWPPIAIRGEGGGWTLSRGL